MRLLRFVPEKPPRRWVFEVFLVHSFGKDIKDEEYVSFFQVLSNLLPPATPARYGSLCNKKRQQKSLRLSTFCTLLLATQYIMPLLS